ncbi:hypothetical protein GW17_00060917 [Ensete ventricosum]|nr:hypothetical protein GW17_00060917 [Ensete ventricosum]
MHPLWFPNSQLIFRTPGELLGILRRPPGKSLDHLLANSQRTPGKLLITFSKLLIPFGELPMNSQQTPDHLRRALDKPPITFGKLPAIS